LLVEREVNGLVQNTGFFKNEVGFKAVLNLFKLIVRNRLDFEFFQLGGYAFICIPKRCRGKELPGNNQQPLVNIAGNKGINVAEELLFLYQVLVEPSRLAI